MKKNKKRTTVLFLILLLLALTVGYAALSTTLNINGTSVINNTSWDVHFANLSTTTGSVTPTTAPSIASGNLSISYAVTLAKPGDFYEFTVDVTNAGGIDAKLSAAPTVSGVSTAQDVYTNYTVNYADGTAPAANDTIAAGASKKYRVRVEFDKNISASQLPTSAQNMTLTVSMNYTQA